MPTTTPLCSHSLTMPVRDVALVVKPHAAYLVMPARVNHFAMPQRDVALTMSCEHRA